MSEITFVESDGLQLAVKTIGSGAPLIWAHGLTGTHRSGLRQLHYLKDRFQIIAFDQRGHWRSSAIHDRDLYDAERMASDIGAVLDHLGFQRAVIGGESMGAATALLFALAHPERVRALILATPAFADAPHSERVMLKAQGDLIAQEGVERYLAVTAAQQRSMGWPEEAIAYLAEVRRLHDPVSLATAIQAVPDWVILPDLSPLADFQCPTMLTARAGDPIHPAALAERMAAAFPNARLAQVTTPIADFFLQPQSIGRLYQPFLDGLPTSGF